VFAHTWTLSIEEQFICVADRADMSLGVHARVTVALGHARMFIWPLRGVLFAGMPGERITGELCHGGSCRHTRMDALLRLSVQSYLKDGKLR